MSEKVFGRWDSYGEVLSSFENIRYDYDLDYGDPGYETREVLDEPIPTESELLFASYGGGCYEGDALVLFEKGGQLYEVHASHCSCNGLEDQWCPGETTWAAQALRVAEIEKLIAEGESYDIRWGPLGEHEPEAKQFFMALVRSHVPK